MVVALDYLHDKDVAHRDLKYDNIIALKNKLFELLDFVQARKYLHSQMSYRTGLPGKLPYNSAEQFDPMFYDQGKGTLKADFWYVGTIIYELASLKLPFT